MTTGARAAGDVTEIYARASPAYLEREVSYPFGNTIPVMVSLTTTLHEHPDLPVDEPMRVWVNAFGAVCAIDEDGLLRHLPPGAYKVERAYELGLDLAL